MPYSKLADRLIFDIKFLLWRAEVHLLPSEEITRRYREIERRYLALADTDEVGLVRREIAQWLPKLQVQLNRRSTAERVSRY